MNPYGLRSLKKTCEGCRALEGSNPWKKYCQLGYETRPTGYEMAKPLVWCPKPKTLKAWREESDKKEADHV